MTLILTELRRYFTVVEFKKGLSLRIAYVVLQLADLLMTYFAVSAGHHEINPIMRGLLESPVQLVVFKPIIPLLIAWLIPARLLLPALILLVVVIGFNITELFLSLYL